MGDSCDGSGVSTWAVAGGGGRVYAAWHAIGQSLCVSCERNLLLFFIISKDEPCTLHSLVVMLSLNQAMSCS